MKPLLPLLAAFVMAAPLAAQAGPAPAPAERVHELTEVDVEPALLNVEEVTAVLRRENPVLRSSGRPFGSATVRFVVGADGAVDPARIEIVDAAGPEFAEAARKVVASTRWRPGSAAGAAVPVRVTLPLAFVPDDEGTRPAAPDEHGAYELRDVDLLPQIQNRDEIQRLLARSYPREMRRDGRTGSVTVRMVIRADGTVDPARIQVELASEPGFISAAADVAKQLRFSPARLGEQTVPVWVVLPFSFALEPAVGEGSPLPRAWEIPAPPSSTRPEGR